jgi:hypothetical protein
MKKYDDAVKLWRRWRVTTEADIDRRLDNFRILFAYNSGKIENEAITYSDTREIFENGRVLNYTGSPRTLFELSNQRVCYEFLKPKLAAKEPLTIALIKETHGVLTGGTYDERRYAEQGERPGAFKRHDYGSFTMRISGNIMTRSRAMTKTRIWNRCDCSSHSRRNGRGRNHWNGTDGGNYDSIGHGRSGIYRKSHLPAAS